MPRGIPNKKNKATKKSKKVGKHLAKTSHVAINHAEELEASFGILRANIETLAGVKNSLIAYDVAAADISTIVVGASEVEKKNETELLAHIETLSLLRQRAFGHTEEDDRGILVEEGPSTPTRSSTHLTESERSAVPTPPGLSSHTA